MGKAGWFTTACLAAVMLCGVTAGTAAEFEAKLTRAQRHVGIGNEKLKNNDLEAASKEFEQAISILPDFPDAHVGLGKIAMQRQDFEGALRAFTTAKEAFGKMQERLRAAELQRYIEARRSNEDMADTKARLITPNAPASKGSTATTQMQVTNIDKQIDRNKRIEAPDTRTSIKVPADLHFLIGNAQFRLNRVADARASWEACIDANPDFAPVYNNLAVVYMKQQEYAKAQQSLARAEQLGVKVNPDFKKKVDELAAQKK